MRSSDSWTIDGRTWHASEVPTLVWPGTGAGMSEWMIEPAAGRRDFPKVRHRHYNGTLDAVRDRTPTEVCQLGDRPLLHRTYLCPCGEVYPLQRQR